MHRVTAGAAAFCIHPPPPASLRRWCCSVLLLAIAPQSPGPRCTAAAAAACCLLLPATCAGCCCTAVHPACPAACALGAGEPACAPTCSPAPPFSASCQAAQLSSAHLRVLQPLRRDEAAAVHRVQQAQRVKAKVTAGHAFSPAGRMASANHSSISGDAGCVQRWLCVRGAGGACCRPPFLALPMLRGAHPGRLPSRYCSVLSLEKYSWSLLRSTCGSSSSSC